MNERKLLYDWLPLSDLHAVSNYTTWCTAPFNLKNLNPVDAYNLSVLLKDELDLNLDSVILFLYDYSTLSNWAVFDVMSATLASVKLQR